MITVTITRGKHWIAKCTSPKCQKTNVIGVARSNSQVRAMTEKHFHSKHPGQNIHYEVE